jgi:hypothetical protein
VAGAAQGGRWAVCLFPLGGVDVCFLGACLAPVHDLIL